MAFILTIVGRYLFSSRGDRLFGFVTVFSVIGIAIGVAAINTVQAAQNGIIGLTLAEARRGIPDLTARADAGSMPALPNLLDQLAALEGVTSTRAFVEGQAAASFDGKTEPMVMRGIPRDQAEQLIATSGTDLQIQPQRWFVVLPFSAQRRLGIFSGFETEVMSADGQNTALGWTPRSKDFQVLGFHQQGGSTPTMYAPLPEAQIYLRLQDRWTGVELGLAKDADMAVVQAQIAAVFASVGVDVALESWEQVNVVQADVFRVMKRVMAIVLALIMLIAGFNILASQLMLIREKRMSIAVFRTMGTSKAQLLAVFVLIGLVIGLGGVLAGLALTGCFAWLAGVIGVTIPLSYAVGDLVSIAAIAVGVCFLATIYPALRATGIDPALVLRDA